MTQDHLNQSEAAERKHLAYVVGRIASELADYTAKVEARQTEARDLVEHLEDNRSDMDHVEKASMRQSVTMATRVTEHGLSQQEKLARLAEVPYFGRIDVDEGEREGEGGGGGGDRGGAPIYIGIHSFYDDDGERQLVHDWRAPISSMFYEFELGPAHYEPPAGRVECEIQRKRQYRIENRALVFMLESSLNIQDDILQEELSRASDDRMKNIVATIQRDQNAIIRNEKSHTLIIQGAAGSGKTSIALHRIAFLLYRFKDTISSDEVLIISPNRVFAHYISQVLPELGEEMIQETTMEEIATRRLGPQFRFQTFAEQVFALLRRPEGDYAQRVAFKATGEFVEALDGYIGHFRNTNFQPVGVTIGLYDLDAEWVAARFRARSGLSVNDQLTRVSADIAEYMQVHHQKSVTPKERQKLRADLKAMFTCTTLKEIYRNFYDWLGRPEMFKLMKGGRYEYADVYPLIYLMKLVEATPPVRRIKHLVVDEMQDYTAVQYRVLDSMYPCNRTILGDCNQSVSPMSASSAESIGEALPGADRMYMHRSYRSTIEITELAQTINRNPDLDPVERHGERPTIIACASPEEEIERIGREIRAFAASDHNSLGIICKTQEQAERLREQLTEMATREDPLLRLLDTGSASFSDGVIIATAYLAKGLEFDQVIVPFCTRREYSAAIDRQMLYVACTRAMHRLTLTHTGKPSPLLEAAMQSGAVEVGQAAGS